MNLKPHFSRFLAADPERLHFAAHSHHLWPNVTYDAQVRCWEDAARLADGKWDYIFDELYPTAQSQVASFLGLSDPTTLAFGPNTHSFLMRLLSALPPGRTVRVLASDGEFRSFTRQMRRLEEEGLVRLATVPVEPFGNFAARFAEAASRGGHDLVYVSQVFYDSGYAVPDLAGLVEAVPLGRSLIVIDGYHGFLALPTDLSAMARRAFYLAGGYKYAMAGEGVCFLHAPPGIAPRPRDTGWFAAFGALQQASGRRVAYPLDAGRFLGATFDPSGLYRLSAVMDWLDALGLTAAKVQAHAHTLQEQFVETLPGLGLGTLRPDRLVVPVSEPSRGNFLTFRTPQAGAIHQRLLQAKVVTDYRGDRLRFGFGLYQDEEDVARLCERLRHSLR